MRKEIEIKDFIKKNDVVTEIYYKGVLVDNLDLLAADEKLEENWDIAVKLRFSQVGDFLKLLLLKDKLNIINRLFVNVIKGGVEILLTDYLDENNLDAALIF